jgi:hypothetical protein
VVGTATTGHDVVRRSGCSAPPARHQSALDLLEEVVGYDAEAQERALRPPRR